MWYNSNKNFLCTILIRIFTFVVQFNPLAHNEIQAVLENQDKKYAGSFVIDTGADKSIISLDIIQKLGCEDKIVKSGAVKLKDAQKKII